MRSIEEILKADPECDGEACWYNGETGYTEYCRKHDGMLLDEQYKAVAAEFQEDGRE